MRLSFRPGELEDFPLFHYCCFCHDRDNLALRAVLEYEWQVFFANPASFAMIVEDTERPPQLRCVGFAQTVFVTDAYVEYVSSSAPPYANLHASRQLPDGTWPLLDANQVRAANGSGGEGLNALTVRWTWSEAELDAGEQRQVRDYMDQIYPLFYRGYRYKCVLIEATGSRPREMLEQAGFRLLNDYADYYHRYPPAPLPHHHPYLMGMISAEADTEEGTSASRLFGYTRPRFGFKPYEQTMLWLALLGLSDTELADRLDITKGAVKKRWDAIYDRVEDRDVGLLPSGEKGNTRGQEKRRLLLRYLNLHLEELRPTIHGHTPAANSHRMK